MIVVFVDPPGSCARHFLNRFDFCLSLSTHLLFLLLLFWGPKSAIAPPAPSEGLPPSLERVGKVEAYPNEYPGQVYAFNWCLNGDGVTPVNKSAFRISKPLDLKVAGLPVPKKSPLMVSGIATD